MSYGRLRGDPGFFSTLGKIGGGILGIASTALPGPLGTAARLGSRLLRPAGPRSTVVTRHSMRRMPSFPALAPTGPTAPMATVAGAQRKRRRMNYGNVKALRRADRRIDGFVKVARNALKHTNYKVVSRSAGTRGGSRGVITRREASRALAR